jgi:tetratricopeptide (TPR) repeat protein
MIRDEEEATKAANSVGLMGSPFGLLPPLAAAVLNPGRTNESLKVYRECLQLREKLAGANPGVPRFRDQLAWTHVELAQVYHRLQQFPDRNRAMSSGIRLLEGLYTDFKDEGLYGLSLARAFMIVGYWMHDNKLHAEAVEWFSKVIQVLAPAGPDPLREAAPRLVVRDAYWTRAIALNELKQPRAALADLDRALALDDGSDRLKLRLEHARTLVRLRDPARAVAEAEELAGDRSATQDTCFELAVVFCLCAAVVKEDDALSQSERQRQVKALHERALQLLIQAQELGFFQDAKKRTRFEEIPYLQPIRDQFKKASGWSD